MLLTPMLAACGFDAQKASNDQISWTQEQSSRDIAALPISVETVQAADPIPPSPTELPSPTEIPPTTAPTLPIITNTVLTPEELQRYQPNELGYVPVIMYHNIVQEYGPDEEGNVLYRTEAELRSDLQWLYDHDFYVVTLREYIENRITAPAGKHPVVLTFDDSRPNQLYFDIADDGSVTIDPHSVVGILLDFYATHPNFGNTALFAILPIHCFDYDTPTQTPYCQQKLQWLAANGFEIANHTWDHQDLTDVSNDVFKQKIGDTIEFIEQNVGSEDAGGALILPYGTFPDTDVNKDALQQWKWLRHGFDYDGRNFQIWTAVAAGAEPAPSPNSVLFDPMSIARIGGKNKPLPGEQDRFLDFWFGEFANRPDLLYTSDGNPDTITVPIDLPSSQQGTLDTEKIETDGKQLIQY